MARDDRTIKLIKLFSDNYSEEENAVIAWNWNKIKEFDLTEFDCYRITRLFTGMKRSDISKYQEQSFDNGETKIFTIEEEVKALLQSTKPVTIKEEIKMPFERLYVDTDLFNEKKDIRVFGLNLNLIKEEEIIKLNEIAREKLDGQFSEKEIENQVAITCYVFSEEINDWQPHDILFSLSTGKEIKKWENPFDPIRPIDKKIQKKVSKFVIPFVKNLLLFLNEPRVSLYIQERNNHARKKKGLIPIPSLLRTRVEYGLKTYIQKIYFHGLSHSKLGYSYWVRGHWREFNSPKFVNMRGKKIWISPHLAGEGLTPPQVFDIKKAKTIKCSQTSPNSYV